MGFLSLGIFSGPKISLLIFSNRLLTVEVHDKNLYFLNSCYMFNNFEGDSVIEPRRYRKVL